MRDRTIGDTFYMQFTTRAFATGIPTTLAGTPVVSAYEDDSITQITAGVTLDVDHDGVSGLNLLTIVATGGNGFETGKDYTLVVTTGTVSGVSVVGEVVGEFSLDLSAPLKAIDLLNDVAVTDIVTGGAITTSAGAVSTVTLVINDVGITQAAADKAWLTATRELTSGTNIVLAKGIGVTGFNDIAATEIVTGGAITTSSGNANADIIKINGIVVVGAGNSGDLWRA